MQLAITANHIKRFSTAFFRTLKIVASHKSFNYNVLKKTIFKFLVKVQAVDLAARWYSEYSRFANIQKFPKTYLPPNLFSSKIAGYQLTTLMKMFKDIVRTHLNIYDGTLLQK